MLKAPARHRSQLSWTKVDSFGGNFTAPALLAPRPCPVCDSFRARVVLEHAGFQFFSDSAKLPKRADVVQVQCLDCFALFMNPCYSDYGFRVLMAEAAHSYGASPGRPDEQVAWLGKRGLLPPGACVLDVGCADGRFLLKLPPTLERVGVDIDAPSIARAKANPGAAEIELICADFSRIQVARKVDLITMFHILEHLPAPVAVLDHLRSVSRPSTRLVVEVPILEREATSDVSSFLAVQHLTHFSRTSLANVVARAGWRVISSEAMEYNAVRVIAEPAQPTPAVAGEPADVAVLSAYLADWHWAVEEANRRLLAIRDVRRLVLWGGGLHTEMLYHTTALFQVRRDREYSIVDSDPVKHGTTWRGIAIHPPECLDDVDWTDTSLLISSYYSQEPIRRAALTLDVPPERIVALYDSVVGY